MTYHELSLDERITIRVGLLQSLSLREIARQINRSPSTVNREIRRNSDTGGTYTVSASQEKMKTRRIVCRPKRKLLPDSELFDLVWDSFGHYHYDALGQLLKIEQPKQSQYYAYDPQDRLAGARLGDHCSPVESWQFDWAGNPLPALNAEQPKPQDWSERVRLPGQYHDAETNLYYNRHRYYDPKLGNYINQDPIGLASGEPNLTVYPRNPVQGMDPLGLIYGLGKGPYGQAAMISRNATEDDVVEKVVLKTALTVLNPPDAGDLTRVVLQNSRGPSPVAIGDSAAFGACYDNNRIQICVDRLDEYEDAAKADKSIGKHPTIQIFTEAIRDFGVKRSLCESENVCDLRGYVKEPAIWPPSYKSCRVSF